MERHFSPIMGNDDMPEYLSVISSSMCARIRIDDIEVIEQEGRKLHIITAAREYCFYENISSILMILAGRAFYRPIRGLIINFDHVRAIEGNTITLHSGQCINLGKNSTAKTRQAYKNYLRKYPPYSLWGRGEYAAAAVREKPAGIEMSEVSEQN